MSQGNSTVSLGVVSLGVGIDTARYGHHVSFLDEQKRTAAKSFHFTESAAGYQQLQAALMKLAQSHPGVHFHIRLDAAGQYAENLLQWLHRLPLSTTISVGNRRATRLTARFTSTNARRIPWKAWRVRGSRSSNGPPPRPTIRRNFGNCAMPSP